MFVSMRSGTHRKLIRARRVASAFAACILPLSAAAQSDYAVNRFEYRLGVQAFSRFTSAIRLDSAEHATGTRLRLEDDVNLEERVEVARIDADYNFNERHYLWLAAYDVERTGRRDILRDIHFGDETFTIDASVSALFEERIAKLSYGFNALRRPRGALGPTFGLHVMELRAALAVVGSPVASEASTTAPLPVFGVRGHRRFGERWVLQAALQWFDVEVGDFDGLFTDSIVTLEHATFARFGFGVGINSNSLDIESGDDDFRGTIDLSFSSVLLYFRGSVGGSSRQRR